MAASFLTRSQYAAHIGRSPSYVTQLAAQCRVVFTPDGRFVDVAKTNALVASTADPAKQGVVDRHAAARAEKSGASDDQPSRHLPRNDTDPEPAQAGYDFQGSKAKREHFAAEREHAAYLKEVGELMVAEHVHAAFSEAGTLIRAALERLPQTLPPQLVNQPEDVIQRLLAESVEASLANLSATFGKLSKSEAAKD